MAFKLLKVALFLQTFFWTIHGWDYSDHGASWPSEEPDCGGRNQSPIEILDKDVTNINSTVLPFRWNLASNTNVTFGIDSGSFIILSNVSISNISLTHPNGTNSDYSFIGILGSSPAQHKINGVSGDRKSTRLNSSHIPLSRMPSSA